MKETDTPEHIKQLALKWQEGTITESEKKQFEGWYHSLDNTFEMQTEETQQQAGRRIYQTILEKGGIAPQRRISWWPRIAVAAAVATLIFGAGLFYYSRTNSSDQQQQIATAADIAPGKQGATLTLASGQQIRLGAAVNGELAKEAGVVITKSASGELTYEIQDDLAGAEKINTLSTAKGETYKLRLPDGTLVWLNSASSLTYSAALVNSGRRMVRLQGEGYFEVAKDKLHPFVVASGGQQVEVLGTHFNINSYADEPAVATTLLEGSVKVTAGDHQQMIRPGQQAVNAGGRISVHPANLETITDWKDGDFYLEGVDFKTAMRKIARWYDVEVVYDPSVGDDIEPAGWISRSSKLSEVLKLIESSGLVRLRVEGRKLYVYK